MRTDTSNRAPDVDTLRRFLSRLEARHALAHAGGEGRPAAGAGVVVFFDISEFTPLTTRYASLGTEGLEAFSGLINRYFTDLLAPVHEADGDALAFFGDAVLVLFTDDDPRGITPDLMRRALRCALAARDRCHNYPTGDASEVLKLKTTVAAGDFEVSEVQAAVVRRRVLVHGDVMRQLERLQSLGVPGEILVSREAQAKTPRDEFEMRRAAEVTVLASGTFSPGTGASPRRPRDALPLAALTPYLDATLVERVSSLEFAWLAEFRTITSLFVNIRLAPGTPESAAAFQSLYAAIAPHVAAHGGSILRFGVEDKGIVFSCAFGIPGHPTEGAARSAIQAGSRAMHAAAHLGHEAFVGCATGRQYYGPVGDDFRAEFRLLGETVNLAARLAGVHSAHLVCDRVSAESAKVDGRSLIHLPPFVLKGYVDPMPVYFVRDTQAGPPREAELVGRAPEKQVFEDALRAAMDRRHRCIVVTGEAGIGKSRLIGFMRGRAASAGAVVASGVAKESTRRIPYAPWLDVLRQLGGEAYPRTADDLAAVACAALPAEDRELYPVLGELFGIAVAETHATRELVGHARSDTAQRLLAHLIGAHGKRGPLVVVVDNAHWFDSASWALLETLRRSSIPALLVVSARSGESWDDAYHRLLADDTVQVIHLESLSREHSRVLLRNLLGEIDVAESLVDELYLRADGHPFFTEELFYSLRDRGALVVDGGRCELRAIQEHPGAAGLAESIKAAITSRFDRLGTIEQMLLKIASAIGESVPVSLWRSAVATLGIGSELTKPVSVLCDLEFMAEKVSGEVVDFKHAITRDVVYEMLTHVQRETIHGAIVKAYGASGAVGSSNLSAVIASHCVNARMIPEAMRHYESASSMALAAGAYREAELHAANAQLLAREQQVSVSPSRLARWEFLRGEAAFRQGRLTASRQHFEAALSWLGRSGRPGRLRIGIEVSRCLLVQAAKALARPRLARSPVDDTSPAGPEQRLLVATYERLARLSFFFADLPLLVRYVFLCVEASEELPDSAELAKSYAGVSLLCGFSPLLNRLAAVYARRARAVAGRLPRRTATGEIELILATGATGDARWDDALRSVDTAIPIFGRVNESQSLAHCRTLRLEVCIFRGEFAQARQEIQHVGALGKTSGNLQLEVWALVFDTWIWRRTGELAKILAAAPRLDTEPVHVAERAEPVAVGSGRANLAFALARQGDLHACEELAMPMLEPALFQHSPNFYSAELWFPLIETLVLLQAGVDSNVTNAMYARATRSCVRALRAVAARHRVARPAAALAMGFVAMLRGRRARAVRLLRDAQASATVLRMPHEAARARGELHVLGAGARRGEAAPPAGAAAGPDAGPSGCPASLAEVLGLGTGGR